ncbi:biosynthetic arginine decarboxylase [Colwellia sp. E2M01]|uniref:biosynthetic arginine decarboxylase n=1 Tax=Colwellia sp. E2M01 TaxID=2841561 RepID=UPI001C08FB28|nr:biosynthetic arginine decarboxylase [Colwellia sp. E2M01]MBU2871751.1 biosynthetic arginine decarboxylase [Colwellia sp. E2M01]
MKSISSKNWSIDRAAELYGIREWSSGYFDVNEKGEMVCSLSFSEESKPLKKSSKKGAVEVPESLLATSETKVNVSLVDIISGMKERGMEMPVLLRFENLIEDRLTKLNEAFGNAIKASGYKNYYRGVFPIKVNQQAQVIEEISEFGSRYHHGLEAGSKAELIIALASLTDNDACIVCNGYKDDEFISLGLHAIQLGINCFFVVETLSEIPLIIAASKKMNVKPLIGVRLKLASKVDGYWSSDSGDRSIFGLTTSQLMEAVDQLRAADMIDCLQLLHCHLGSQIPNIQNIRSGVLEACRYYSELRNEGVPLGYLDLGGGLAVDYEGAYTNSTHSMNYNLDEYCADIVEAIIETLDPLGIEHPVILTESGRATVAYSSVLLFNILDVTHFEPAPIPKELEDDASELVKNMHAVLDIITVRNVQECFNDASHYRDEIRENFRRGRETLRSKALGENIYLAILQKIVVLLPQVKRISTELENLPESLADIYYGNFSVFQSLPDSWAIDQIFPIMPIHRLDEVPTRDAILADLTCDCDGKIDSFTVDGLHRKTLPVHDVKEGEDYFFGAFLVGAYQETLGDLHNLFGDTNVVSVRVNSDGSYDYVKEMEGDSISDVLSYVEYYPKALTERFRQRAEKAVKSGHINVAERQTMLKNFSESLGGYTYFEK